ncbi:MAG: cysteine hydrolase [Thermodesulfobacteriaceae bacterium]|nr:cysteine hydrolase [Thermodesulfobacteriaceae bacterium]MCX8042114.1 cysteine hydrolase [Thermodesulfobacteriaceae bacterium]MDW8136210.1 isochorismatase family cysteine hydrolase [Thermodesulfobacterium sp.]
MKSLLIIDMLYDFIKPEGVLYCGKEAEKIIPEISKLKVEFRKEKLPVIYLCDSHEVEDEEFSLFPPHCLKGTKGAQIIKELAPEKEDLIIYKTKFSGFYQTELEKILKELKVTELYLTGVCTSICVMDTAKDAFYRGFKIVIPVRAVADFDEEFHRFSLKRMEKIYGAKLLF